MGHGAQMRAYRNRHLLVIVGTLFALAGCGSSVQPAAHPAADVGPRTVSPEAAAPAAPSTIASSSAVADQALDRRAALLDGLRNAGLPVTPDGELEVKVADIACGMVDRGMTPEQLTSTVVDRFPVTAGRARQMVDIVIGTYC
jgi:hypothetical protein